MRTVALALCLASLSALPAAAQTRSSTRTDPGARPSATVATDDAADAPNFATGLKGLSFALPSAGGGQLGVSYFLAPNAAIRADLGLDFTFTSGGSYAFNIDLGYRMYTGRYGRLLPFLQPSFNFGRAAGAEQVGVGASVGVEYFLLERFTISAETGLYYAIGNTGATGPAAVRLYTGTSALAANFYW